MSTVIGKCRILDTGCYHNLAPAEGKIVTCVIVTDDDGDQLFHVEPNELIELGCEVEQDALPFPFFIPEVAEVKE